MAKGNAKPKGPLQKIVDREQAEFDEAPTVNRFAAQHGDYERNLRFIRNRGGTAIDRWRKDGNLSDSQFAAVLHCQNLWAKLRSPKLVADLQATIRGGDTEEFNVHQIDALDELHRISSAFPFDYWNVFENVCRHDMPAGVAGSRLANTKRSAELAARMIVAFLADMIATKERLSY